MSGVKGRSGTNKNKDKPWSDALRIAALADDADGVRKLRRIAESCVNAAMAGDIQAIREIGDRLDGKPAQESTVTIDDKRDATDWTRDQLVAVLHDAAAGSNGAAKANGRGGGPDSVH